MNKSNSQKRIFELKPWNRGLSDEELLQDLKRVADELGQDTVKYKQYDSYGQCRSRTIEVRLGGWNNALKRAGLKTTLKIGITKDELFKNLEEVWIRLGRQPRQHDMVRPLSRVSKGSYSRHFGTWRKALEEFVAWVNAENDNDFQDGTPASVAKSSPRTPRNPSLRLKFKVMKRDRFSCCHCGRSPALDGDVILNVDHIIPWSKGGETVLNNLQTLCQSCNLGKSNLEERESD